MNENASRWHACAIPTIVIAVLCMMACRQTSGHEGTVSGQWPNASASSGWAGWPPPTPTGKRRIEPQPDRPPPRSDDCQGHFEACMESRLSRKRGGKWGHSVCQDCRDRCKAEGTWPDRTYDNKDCQWWTYPPKTKSKKKH